MGLETTTNRSIAVPDKTLTKKTFQIKKYRILKHALFFLPLREIGPSIVENSIIAGGTAYRNNISITLGRYPVTTRTITLLHTNKNKISCQFVCILERSIKCSVASLKS